MIAKRQMKKTAAGVRELVHGIAEEQFIDWSSEELKGIGTVEYWKTAMSIFSYIGRMNTLYIGSPGSGKTTLAEVVCARCTGLPLDLFNALKIQGHPDQTKDTMLARINFGRLAEEGVVFQATSFLPAVLIDELNRLTPGRQSILLEYIRTGMIEHLGKTMMRDKMPFFATINYNGPGTNPLSPAMLDRFDISLELGRGSCFMREHIKRTKEGRAALCNPAVSREILRKLLDQNNTIDERLQMIQAYDGEIDCDAIVAQAGGLEIDKEAHTLLRNVWEEMNMSPVHGELREVDAPDLSTKAKAVASKNLVIGMSQRAWDSVEFYARMLAMYTECDTVDVEHVRAVLPYCLSHRLVFREDYKKNFRTEARPRGEHEELDLTRRLLGEIKTRFEDPGIRSAHNTLDAYIGNPTNPALQEKAKEIAERPLPDHPLLRAYWLVAREMLAETDDKPQPKRW